MHGYQDGRRTRDSLRNDRWKSVDSPQRETLRQRPNSCAHQERNSSSVQRYESCYRQLYPSKKRKATFKIPKKLPYIPAIYQKRTTTCKGKYKTVGSGPKSKRLQWPALYPSKRKAYPQTKQSEDKSKGLPSWLLPLYSCKACQNSEGSSTSEAHFSGGAFRRRMEIIDSVKQIRAVHNPLNNKVTKKDDMMPLDSVKPSQAVEALKRKIDSMQDYLSAMKNMEDNRKQYKPRQTTNETELSEKLVREAFARIYQTEPVTQERELRVRNSVGLGVTGSKSLDIPLLSDTSNMMAEQCLENAKEVRNNNKIIHSSKSQHDGVVARPPEVESSSTDQAYVKKFTTTEATSNLSLGQTLKESVVMIKQPSWKKIQTPNYTRNNDSTSNKNKQRILNVQTNNDSNANHNITRQPYVHVETNNSSMLNPQQPRKIKVQETKTVEDGGTSPDTWTVESLKSRINVMKIKNTTDETSQKKAEDMSMTRNGGEARPKISQVALRSFHKEAGTRNQRHIQFNNATNVHLGYHKVIGRRNYSTFRPSKLVQPKTRALGYCRRTIFNTTHNPNKKKRDWVNCIKRCFVLKKIKGHKCLNWKDAPREIPYEKGEVKCNSPAPILWTPKDKGVNRTEHKASDPSKVMIREKVNPAVLNAEQRVLASLSRLMSRKPRPDTPDVSLKDVETKIRQAKNKVNIMPWLKRPNSSSSLQNQQQLECLHSKLENEEPHESGYEWILRNRDMVEELKSQSRSVKGKSLVPAEVKHSINKYKVPLKAEIARYRRKTDHQKYSGNIYVCSTSKRWYSTSFAGRHGRILSCSDVIKLNTCGIKTVESRKENSIPGRFLGRKARSDIAIRPSTRQLDSGVPNISSKIDGFHENPEEEKKLKRWTWKIPNKTRPCTPKPTTVHARTTSTSLTSPSKIVGTSMSEMSPCTLKKQVEELKRLIKKAREQVTESPNESQIGSQSEDQYEVRLKRVVKAAHNNAQKMQIAEPTYTSENNMMAKKTSSAKKDSSRAQNESNAKSGDLKCEPEVLVLKPLSKKKNGGPTSVADEILQRNNPSSLPALASNKKSEKAFNKVYLKLKLLVEAVKKKTTMLEPINEVKLMPAKSLKGSFSADSVLLSASALKKFKKPETTFPVTVELQANKIQAPSKTIQLWKGETKPTEFNFSHDKEPSYRDLLALLTRAKELFYLRTPGEANLDKIGMSKDNNMVDKNILTQEELTKNLLNIREDVSMAARAIAERPQKVLETTSQAGLSSLVEKQRDSGVDTIEHMMTKSNMIPAEMLKTDSKLSCDHMWANVTARAQENDDPCKQPSSQTNSTNENCCQVSVKIIKDPPTNNGLCSENVDERKAFQSLQPCPESNQQQSQKPISLESTKNLFQKPLAAWESLTKNLGNGVGISVFGKPADTPNNTVQETTAVVNDKTTHAHQQPTVRESQIHNSTDEASNSLKKEHSQDITKEYQSILVGNVRYNTPHVSDYYQEMVNACRTKLHQNPSNSTENKMEKSNDQYVQNCIDHMKPLEESVKKYETYYRDYFSKDIVSGYEHLHQVYKDLSKLSNVVGCHCTGNPFKKDPQQGNAFTPSSQNVLGKSNQSQESVNICLGGQISERSKQNQTVNQHGVTAMATCGTLAPSESGLTGGVFGSGLNTDTQMSHLTQEPNARNRTSSTLPQPNRNIHNDRKFEPVTASCSTQNYLDSSGNIKEGIQLQGTEVSESQSDKTIPKLESCSKQGTQLNGMNSKDESSNFKSSNFKELLTHDPTLNPEVVKNLKLPVIQPDDCHAEKNWYTKFYSGPHRNH